MTYNFDPERWYDNERAFLDSRLASGRLRPEDWERAVADLERRYDEMLARLDGTYRVVTPDKPERKAGA